MASDDLTRRESLKIIGLSTLGMGMSGCALFPPTSQGESNNDDPIAKPQFSFERTVTLDVTSGDNIDQALQDAIQPNTLVQIPSGTYRIAQSVEMPSKGGIEGLDDVTLLVAADKSFRHIDADASILYVNNLNYDLSNERNAVGIKAYVDEKGYVGNVEISGHADADSVPPGLALAAREQEAVLMIEEFRDEGRGTGSHTGQKGGNGRMAIWSGNSYHEGLAYVKNCTVIDAANNAIYASNLGTHGRFHVNGGVFKHSYGAGVRTGGNGSVIENVYIEVDMRESKRDWWGAQPAIRWEVKGKSKTSKGTIRNCDIRMINGDMGQGIRLQRSAAQVTIKNCRVQIEETETTPLAIYGTGEDAYKYPAPDDDRRIYVDGLQVSGSAARDRASITVGPGRDGSVIENCSIPGGIDSESEIVTRNNVEEMGTSPRTPQA